MWGTKKKVTKGSGAIPEKEMENLVIEGNTSVAKKELLEGKRTNRKIQMREYSEEEERILLVYLNEGQKSSNKTDPILEAIEQISEVIAQRSLEKLKMKLEAEE